MTFRENYYNESTMNARRGHVWCVAAQFTHFLQVYFFCTETITRLHKYQGNIHTYGVHLGHFS